VRGLEAWSGRQPDRRRGRSGQGGKAPRQHAGHGRGGQRSGWCRRWGPWQWWPVVVAGVDTNWSTTVIPFLSSDRRRFVPSLFSGEGVILLSVPTSTVAWSDLTGSTVTRQLALPIRKLCCINSMLELGVHVHVYQ
jgi:hypothetical protein